MLFGEKFYPLLNKMPAWRHSLFALVLATRQYPNFALWCELKETQGKAQYLNALKAAWRFHYDKFNHIDLSAAFDEIAPFLPMELEEYSEGDSFAFDAAVMLDAALSSVPDNSKGAINASQASLSSVIRYCEHAYPDNCATEDDLLELPPIQAEMSFQIDLMEQVRLPRSPENVIALCQLALESGCSNIGLDNDLTFEDFAECFTVTHAAPAPEDEAESEAEPEVAPEDEPLDGSAPAPKHTPRPQPPQSPWHEHDLIVFDPERPEGEPHAPDLTEPLSDEELTPPEVPSYAQMMAHEVAAAHRPAPEPAPAPEPEPAPEPRVPKPEAAPKSAPFAVEPEDLARTDHNLRQALAEQQAVAAMLDELNANNERLGQEEALIMAQAQALAQAEAHELGARPPLPEHLAVQQVGPRAPVHPDDEQSEVDVDLEFERIAQTAALLEQQLAQELLLEGQDLDQLIASGGELPPPPPKPHKDKHHKHHKDKGLKDKGPKGPKTHKDAKDAPKGLKKDKPGKHDKHGKPEGKKSHKHDKHELKHGSKPDKHELKHGPKPDKHGVKHGPKHDAKHGPKHGPKEPKVFGAHAPQGKAL